MNVGAKITIQGTCQEDEKALSSIIQSNQTAFVAGRYIRESIHLISDILKCADENELSTILFPADFEKAFDLIAFDSFLQLFNPLDLDQNLFSL